MLVSQSSHCPRQETISIKHVSVSLSTERRPRSQRDGDKGGRLSIRQGGRTLRGALSWSWTCSCVRISVMTAVFYFPIIVSLLVWRLCRVKTNLWSVFGPGPSDCTNLKFLQTLVLKIFFLFTTPNWKDLTPTLESSASQNNSVGLFSLIFRCLSYKTERNKKKKKYNEKIYKNVWYVYMWNI